MTGLVRAHIALTVCAAVTYVFVLRSSGIPWFWVGFWTAGLALFSVAYRRPELGLAVYAASVYGTPRYSSLFDVLVGFNLVHVEVFLATTAAILWTMRSGRRVQRPSLLLCLALALFAWGGISAAAARWVGPELSYSMRHTPLFFIHAIVLLLVAGHVMAEPLSARVFVVPLGLSLGVRVWWQGVDGVNLEGDIGPLALMMLPLALLLAQNDSLRSIRTAAVAAAAGALATVALTYNRAAAVAFGVLALLLCWRYRRRRWVLAACVVCIAMAGFWLATTPYRARFVKAWAEIQGQATGSVTERLDLWRTGLRIVEDNPILGVGPSNYAAQLDGYDPSSRRLVAHNNYVSMAAETGFPGVVLYVALFGVALVIAGRTLRRHAHHWVGATAGAVQLSLVVYLTAGLFISRHDMVLAYILAGWVAALSDRVSPSRGASTADEPAKRGLDR